MRTVYRYKLDKPVCEIEMPKGATPIAASFNGKMGLMPGVTPEEAQSIESQEEAESKLIPVVDLFAEVETDNPMEKRTFLNIGCGQGIPNSKPVAFIAAATYPQRRARMVYEQV